MKRRKTKTTKQLEELNWKKDQNNIVKWFFEEGIVSLTKVSFCVELLDREEPDWKTLVETIGVENETRRHQLALYIVIETLKGVLLNEENLWA